MATAAREFWKSRYEDINAFEHHLERNGTKIVKFFLHVSKAEQKRRFLARLDTPGKEWKFNAADVAERALWDEYMQAYEKAITATSTPWAPWYVIPADRKRVMQAMVAAVLVDTISGLGLAWPTVSEKDAARPTPKPVVSSRPNRTTSSGAAVSSGVPGDAIVVVR